MVDDKTRAEMKAWLKDLVEKLDDIEEPNFELSFGDKFHDALDKILFKSQIANYPYRYRQEIKADVEKMIEFYKAELLAVLNEAVGD